MKRFWITILIFCLIGICQSLYAQRSTSFGVLAEVSIPMGDFSDIAGTGFGGALQFQNNVSEKAAILAVASYVNWGAKTLSTTILGDNTIEIGTDAKVYAFHVGGKYFFSPGKTRFYGLAVIGLYTISADVETNIPVDELDVVLPIKASGSEGKFSAAPGIGLEADLSDKVRLDISGRYQFVTDSFSNIAFWGGFQFVL